GVKDSIAARHSVGGSSPYAATNAEPNISVSACQTSATTSEPAPACRQPYSVDCTELASIGCARPRRAAVPIRFGATPVAPRRLPVVLPRPRPGSRPPVVHELRERPLGVELLRL